MYTEELINIQREWANAGLLLMRDLLPLMMPVSTYKDWEWTERDTIGKLLSASARSTESALLLVAYGQLWDAEVLIRSVFEGTLKFAYLLQSEEAFKGRFHEFATQQPDIAALQDDKKARELLDIPSEYECHLVIPIGYPGEKEGLPEELQEKERPTERRPIKESIFKGKFGRPL